MSSITRHANNAIEHFEDQLDNKVFTKVITAVWNILIDSLVDIDGSGRLTAVSAVANYINKTI